MYKPRMHVEDYFMPIEFGRNNYGRYKVDCNKIICTFFNEEGKPRYEEMATCENIMQTVGYELPKNKRLHSTYKQKFQRGIILAVNWLCEEHGLNVLQIKMDVGKNKEGKPKSRVCYGFSKHLQNQADNIDRKISFRDAHIERTKNRKINSNKRALKLLKHEEDRYLEHKKVV